MIKAQVILDIPTKGIDTIYSYRVSPHIAQEAQVGCLCVVPLASRFVLAWIVALEDVREASDTPHSLNLKDICEVVSPSYFGEDDAQLALWMAHYYMAPLSSALRLFSPTGALPRIQMRKEGDKPYKLLPASIRQHYASFATLSLQGSQLFADVNLNEHQALRRAPKQYELLSRLAQSPASVDEIKLGGASNVPQLIRSLKTKGLIDTWDIEEYCISGKRVLTLDAKQLEALPHELLWYLQHEQSTFELLLAPDNHMSAMNCSSVCVHACKTHTAALSMPDYELTAEQQAALTSFMKLFREQEQRLNCNACKSECDADDHYDACADTINPSSPVLLIDGVTGSGKTEVYMRALEEILSKGRTGIVLVPEIALSSQMEMRFRKRFGSKVALLHSALSNQERFDQLELIRKGFVSVVLGPRSALFAPMKNKGLIIIDEEHERTYKQEQAPRYDARLVAQKMMELSGGVVILGSATPSITSLYSVNAEETWMCARLTERANKTKLPPITLVDMSLEFKSGLRSMFSRVLQQEMCIALKAGHKVVLLLNQRGFAQFLLCRDCGHVPLCPACEMSLTVHEDEGILRCHYCNFEQGIPPVCPQCESPYLKRFGAGTQRVEAALKELLREEGIEVPVIRMDADTTQKKNAHTQLLKEFASAQSAVLLGTQMIAKGLDFPDIALVGVINADTQLYLPDYRSQEMSFALIEQVAGRAGRHKLPGKVIVQSYNPDNVAIKAASLYDRDRFLREEMTKRQDLSYPPFVRFINVLIWSDNYELLKEESQKIYDQLYTSLFDAGLIDTCDVPSFEDFAQKSIDELLEDSSCIESGAAQLLPPAPCSFAKIRNAWRYHILIKAPVELDIQAVLEPCVRKFKYNKQVQCAVDVDPQSLL